MIELQCQWMHHLGGNNDDVELALCGVRGGQFGLRSLGRHERRGEHRLYAHHSLPFRHHFHRQGRAQRETRYGRSTIPNIQSLVVINDFLLFLSVCRLWPSTWWVSTWMPFRRRKRRTKVNWACPCSRNTSDSVAGIHYNAY